MTANIESAVAATRAPGRPRSSDADAAIIDATLQVLLESGVRGLTIEAVAARSGVAKTTVYRRWSTKDDLIIQALATLYEPLDDLPGTSFRDDLFHLADAIHSKSHNSLAGQLLPRIIAEASSYPEQSKRFQEQVIGPRRERMRARLQQAVDERDLPADADIALMADLITGPIVWRFMAQSMWGPADDEYPRRVADAVLRSFTASQ